MWITTNCGKFLKRWEYWITLPASWETCMQIKKQQLESYMEQWTCSKLGKQYVLNIQSTVHIVTLLCRGHHAKCQVRWSTSWNQDYQEKYQQPQICRWYHVNGRKWRGTIEPLDEGERGEWKGHLKNSILKKTNIMASSPTTSWQIEGEKVEAATDFLFLGLKSLQMMTAGMKLEDNWFLDGKLWQT